MFAHEGSLGGRHRRIPLVTIDKVVAARLGQTRVQGNAQPAVFNRQVAIYLAKHVGGWSTTRIGRFYNGRDHSTVCHALKKVEMLRNSQPEIDELLADLKAEIVSEGQGNSSAPHNDIRHPEPRAGEVILTDEFLDLVVDRLAAAFSAGAQPSPRFTKGICSVIFPKEMPRPECFAQARSAGFDAMELSIGPDLPLDISRDDARRMADVAAKAGIRIVTLWVSEALHQSPLNAADPYVRARGVEAIRRAIAIATDMNCGAVLLYAVCLGNGARLEYGSQETWDRFTAELAKVVPDAERAKVSLNPENVSNKFLLSPLEMRSFVDQFHSDSVGMHFDTGNCMPYGYPEDWILTLGKRIRRIHFKDYKLAGPGAPARPADLLEGDVNWKAVMAALVETGYNGPISPEIGRNPGKPDHLREVSAALDKILAMA